MNTSTDFRPRWACPPGATLAELLEERQFPRDSAAARLGATPAELDSLLKGDHPIDDTLAWRLAELSGASASFWLSREAHYREALAEQAWVKDLPLRDMINWKWLPKVSTLSEKIDACLDYFSISSVQEWRSIYGPLINQAAFKTSPSFDSRFGAVAAWLREGERRGTAIRCTPWDAERFRHALPAARALIREKSLDEFLPKLQDLCAACGVAVVLVRAPEGCRASGATRFLAADKALLLLSNRYLREDHFWFAFFHEAGHLILHGKDGTFVEGIDGLRPELEAQANLFAERVLIPEDRQAELCELPLDKRAIISFAMELGVTPGIIVGQLYHLGRIQPNQFTGLYRRYPWAPDAG